MLLIRSKFLTQTIFPLKINWREKLLKISLHWKCSWEPDPTFYAGSFVLQTNLQRWQSCNSNHDICGKLGGNVKMGGSSSTRIAKSIGTTVRCVEIAESSSSYKNEFSSEISLLPENVKWCCYLKPQFNTNNLIRNQTAEILVFN